MNPREFSGLLAVCLFAAALARGSAQRSSAQTGGARFEDLVAFFKDFRAFQKPKVVGGVPDYGIAAMAAQKRELESYKKRLAAIDPSGWPIPQQVDWHMVRAEVNGLDFDHRVLKPWANDPAFYVTVFGEESDQPAREGPFALGAVEVWSYKFPLSAADAAKMATGIRSIPALLAQAKSNLTGNGHDFWQFGAKAIRQQSAELDALAKKLSGQPSDLAADVDKAKRATDEFAGWLESKLPEKTGPSGIGVENYDWYLKNVQLVPYTYAEEFALMERELARSRALLDMEEIRNAKLPAQEPVASNAAEYDAKFNAAVTEYMAFLRDRDILTVEPWMDGALRERVGHYAPPPREFFSEVDYRDPEVLRTHSYHWFDKGFLVHHPSADPIRRETLLYNIFNTRTEGHATGWEELMMQAGMVDARPRSRELVYILVAQRAARALGELMMHGKGKSLEEASAFACAHVPRGWLRMDGNLVRWEQFLYLQQPGYGTSYLIGKMEIDKLLAERKRQLGDKFRMKEFMDDFNSRGLIPAALLRWEMTGEKTPDIERMLAPSH
jgi:Bacterial protein of unknown function (DUF885)